jgi:hypothetical protein
MTHAPFYISLDIKGNHGSLKVQGGGPRGGFGEMVSSPLGDYSINTHQNTPELWSNCLPVVLPE